MSLRIENLTQEDSGQYRARASFQGGIDLTQVFTSLSMILVKSASITPDWCNATLEGTASGDTKDLKVTWESKGLLRELEQRATWGQPSNSWTLSVSLLLSQPSVSLTCVVSNQVDQKTATLDLEEVCAHGATPKVSPLLEPNGSNNDSPETLFDIKTGNTFLDNNELLNVVVSSIGNFILYDWQVLMKALLKPGEYLQWTM
ncbi:hypothetical protein E5288_WYG014840 [Bos mutus]|uniref:Ig-like domain-containing protein n=1 Tax=Bos mutus TaxID=72004 RepID=A0A6B0S2W7_9CETA|nr:hypothetical protein [Bos mutus]